MAKNLTKINISDFSWTTRQQNIAKAILKVSNRKYVVPLSPRDRSLITMICAQLTLLIVLFTVAKKHSVFFFCGGGPILLVMTTLSSSWKHVDAPESWGLPSENRQRWLMFHIYIYINMDRYTHSQMHVHTCMCIYMYIVMHIHCSVFRYTHTRIHHTTYTHFFTDTHVSHKDENKKCSKRPGSLYFG